MAWTTTPLWPGPLANDNYNYPIIGLSANTKYIYRAYFIVSGVTYYGNILTGTTAAIALTAPTLTTGTAGTTMETSFPVIGNEVDNKGNAPIVEYGILYTQLGFWGTNSNLIYSNVNGSYVYSASTHNVDIAINSGYTKTASNLTPSTTTYYRAFAKNAAGVGYGIIKTAVTASPPIVYNNVDVFLDWDDIMNCGSNDGMGGAMRLYCCNGTLVESCALLAFTKHVTVNWSVPTGCYYMDFSGIQAYCDYNQVTYNFAWSDNTYFGENSICTCCFTGDNIINAELPVPMY